MKEEEKEEGGEYTEMRHDIVILVIYGVLNNGLSGFDLAIRFHVSQKQHDSHWLLS